MANPPADWIKSAVKITPGFEVAGDPYMGASGNFDGMGISCGALQWNIGQNSLQPMVKAVGQPAVLAAMPTYGAQMWTACTGTVKNGLTIVNGWQNGTTLKPVAKAELRALMGSTAMRVQQDKVIGEVAGRAYAGATTWARGYDNGTPSKRLFCWFFDIVTQNGGLETLAPQKVKDFIAANSPDRADDVICDFLAAVKGPAGHVKDANKNAALWRNKPDAEQMMVLVMSYLRSKTANPKWQHVVLNRKGTIAMGEGWVNGAKWDFSSEGL